MPTPQPNSSPSRSQLLSRKGVSFTDAVEERIKDGDLPVYEQLDTLLRGTHGVSGDMALELFRKGAGGARFSYGVDGTPIAETLGEKDQRFIVDGEEIPPAKVEEFRKYLNTKKDTNVKK
jgi:hypothetical protein